MAGSVEGLRSADWIIPELLLAISMPSGDEFAALAELGITDVIALVENPPSTGAALAAGLRYHHLYYRDMTAPSERLIVEFLGLVKKLFAKQGRIAVHCVAGLGRTGTLMACYLVSEGMDAGEAIALVRANRPGSIQTVEQEAAVGRYAAGLRAGHRGSD